MVSRDRRLQSTASHHRTTNKNAQMQSVEIITREVIRSDVEPTMVYGIEITCTGYPNMKHYSTVTDRLSPLIPS